MKGNARSQIALNADVHIHSSLSPCAADDMLPSNIIEKLETLDIDIFSITDHNSCKNSSAFMQAAKEKGMLFIPGIEIQTQEEIHLLAYFQDVPSIETFYNDVIEPVFIPGMQNDPEKFGNQLIIDRGGRVIDEERRILSLPLNISIDLAVLKVREYGGVAVPAHLDRGFSLISQLGFIPPKLLIDGVEISDVGKIDEFKQKYLKSLDVRVLASSDTHHLHMFKPPKMSFRLPDISVRSCLDCIRGSSGSIFLKSGRRAANKAKKRLPDSGHDWKSIYG